LSELNQKPEVLGKHHFPKKLKIYDTTLRDGEQTIGVSFDKGEKLEIAKMLDEMGVDRIEAGMPVVSKEDREAVELILKAGLKAEIWGFCRAVKGDIEACADVGVRHVIVEIATSSIKMKANNFTPEGVLGKIVDSLQYAKSRDLYTAYFAVDATRADLRYLETVYKKAVEEGKADEVVMVDTLGVATPETMFYLTKKLREWVKVPIMTHCHSDFGMAVACTFSSVKAGADCAHVTINGLGEKTGNADLAETVFAAKLYGIETNININNILALGRILEKIVGRQLWSFCLGKEGMSGSQAEKTAEKIMKFVNSSALKASQELAIKRGSFPNKINSIYKKDKKPLRNATRTTIAPTGTIAIIANCSEGIEPLFNFVFNRNSTYGTMLEINPLFIETAKKLKLTQNDVEKIGREGSLQRMPNIPENIKKIFKTAHDISPEWHIRIQSAFQKYTDNAISKTVNLAQNATPEDIENVFLLAYKHKLKGLTIYRYNSRKEQVLEFCKRCDVKLD
jgi:hypothetical protein